MKKRNIIYLFIGILCAMVSCVSEDELVPSGAIIPISSVSATFAEGSYTYNQDPGAIFRDTVPTGGQKVDFVIPVPWFYPESSNNETEITKMQIRAEIGNGCYLSPDLTIYDLTQKHNFTLTDFDGKQTQITITGERFKLPYCEITSLEIINNITGESYDAIINEKTKEISIISADDLSDVNLALTLSPHASATISSGSFEHADLGAEPTITVTAHDGISTKTYSLRRIAPVKMEQGLRKGSEKLIWSRTLTDMVGGFVLNNISGIGVSSKYVFVNERNKDLKYFDRFTGENAGTIILPFKGNLDNFFITNDDKDNILVCNLHNAGHDADGLFTVYRIKGTNAPEKYIEVVLPAKTGRKLSVNGNLDGDAIIASTKESSSIVYYWLVRNGVLQSQTPQLYQADGEKVRWNFLGETAPTGLDISDGMFLAGYGGGQNGVGYFNSEGNAAAMLDLAGAGLSGWVNNALDRVVFNDNAYLALGTVAAPNVKGLLYDVQSPANLGISPKDPKLLMFESPSISAPNNGNSTSDIHLKVSDNGFYMVMYIMGTNGSITAYQFDCIDVGE